MAKDLSSAADSSGHVKWMWQSKSDSIDRSKINEWNYYSDVENIMIEEAFQTKQSYVMLDNYCIDIQKKIQISKKNINDKTPIKRTIVKIDDVNLLHERFNYDPVVYEQSFGGQYGWIPPFIKEIKKELKLGRNQLPSRDPSIVPGIVEKAALGIIEEGKRVGQMSSAKWMATELRNRKNTSIGEIWQFCAHIYSMEDFLYKTLNETMRLVGSKRHETNWRDRIRTLGPYCLLLWDNPFNRKATTKIDSKILYRGANLTEAQINYYQTLAKQPDMYGSFQAFTSCSRSRPLIENSLVWNVVFIIEITFAFTANIQDFSMFPQEEEELVFPGVCFTVQRVEFDNTTKKHRIYLNLRQRFNKSAIHEIYNKQRRTSIDKDSYREAYYAARRSSIVATTIDQGYLDRDIYVRDYGIDE